MKKETLDLIIKFQKELNKTTNVTEVLKTVDKYTQDAKKANLAKDAQENN